MAETTKRSTTNSASKSRKSRTDIIRATLGMYLKQKNYTVSSVCTPPPFVKLALWFARGWATSDCVRVSDHSDHSCEQFLVDKSNESSHRT